jgi:CheY-like chemotaxis protein
MEWRPDPESRGSMERTDTSHGRAASGGRRRPSAAHAGLSRDDRERPLVLVVEDNPDELELYGKILWYNGFDVLFAQDGAKGLQFAREYEPELVLLDLGLPEIDGLELCRLLKQRTGNPRMPVVVLTARAEVDYGSRARGAGCDRYLEKPKSPLAVLHEVEKLIGPAPPGATGSPPEAQH